MRNPFRPTFGASPPLLAGRADLISEFSGALADGPGAAGRASIYTGARGAGKTVMLNAIEDEARSQGWIVVSETASPGLIDRLTQSRLPAVLSQLDPDAISRRMTGVSFPLNAGGLTWETLEQHLVRDDLRSQINLLTDVLAENETGLLLTLDEIHRKQIDDLRELTATIQHAVREERELAFAAAGLSSSVSDLLRDEVLTFLRRADRHHLGAVDFGEVRKALQGPIEATHRRVGEDALEVMVEATQGYPFLIQLVGSYCWRAHKDETEITSADVQVGVAAARRRLGSLVHEPALADTSDVDRSFLLAMSEDEGPSRTSDIGERLEVSKGFAGVYRQRLIDADLITAPRRGYVDFTIPYLRDYLRDHAATLVTRV